jgi:hypothetical protein
MEITSTVRSSSAPNVQQQSIWSFLSQDLILQCLLYLDPLLLLGKLSWSGRVYYRAFRQSIENTWEELSEWEDLVEMRFPMGVKMFLAAWNESSLIYQKCLTINRYDSPECQFLRNIRLPSRDECIENVSHSGFICISFERIERVHKDWDVCFASFIDLNGKFGPPGCIVELELVNSDEGYLEIEQALRERQERARFYIGLGYSAHGFGVSAPDFFTWKQMFPKNQFFHDRPAMKQTQIPLIWGYFGGKSWMIDRSETEEEEDGNGVPAEEVKDEDNEEEEQDEQEELNKENTIAYQDCLPELLACYEQWTPPLLNDRNEATIQLLNRPISLDNPYSISNEAYFIGNRWSCLKPHVAKHFLRKLFRHILIKSTRFHECLVVHRNVREARERIYQGYADSLKYYHQNVRNNFALSNIRQSWFEVLAQYCEEIRQREVEEKQNLLWDEDEFRDFLLYPLYQYEILSPERMPTGRI